MPPTNQPNSASIEREIGRFVEIGRDLYLEEIGPRRAGRSYFIVVGDHYLDMKAIWFGACTPKPQKTPNSVTIAPIMERMGFEIVHVTSTQYAHLTALETHKRVESGRWSRNQGIAEERKRIAGLKCEACGFDSRDRYSGIPGTILEVHHLAPFGSLSALERIPVTVDNVVALCPNCHKMIHLMARSTGKNPSLAEFQSSIRLEK